MSAFSPLLQIAQAAMPAGGTGVQSYADDMARMDTVLNAPPELFPWWTMGLLLLLILACLGAMAAVLFLPGRVRRAQNRLS